MEPRTSSRGISECFVGSRHLDLNDLKAAAEDVTNTVPGLKIPRYLFKENLPPFPRPELHVSHLRTDTDRGRDGGFRGPDSLQWWSLAVRPEDIASAETRLLEETYPDRTEEQAQMQQSFLGRFASSPAFLETSRLGSYRFTLPVEEVLEAYSKQFCFGAQPEMRVFETVLYKQEVMYVVLVDSPFSEYQDYPLLSDDPDAVCVYRDGRFIWRSQAMCGTHRFQLVPRPDENQMEVGVLSGSDIEFYVWDHVAIALHVEEGQVLHFDDDKLRENLTFCDPGQASYHQNFDSYEEADEVVCERAWPCYPAPLERERSLQESLAALQSSCSDVSRQLIGRHMAESSPSSTLIIGDSIMASVRMRGAHTLSFPEATVLDIIDKLPDIIRSHPEADRVVIHAGTNEDQ